MLGVMSEIFERGGRRRRIGTACRLMRAFAHLPASAKRAG
jgi:hypothetical protein